MIKTRSGWGLEILLSFEALCQAQGHRPYLFNRIRLGLGYVGLILSERGLSIHVRKCLSIVKMK